MKHLTKEFEMLDRIPVGAMVLNSDFIVLFWNKYLEAWTNLAKDQVVGYPIEKYFPHMMQPKYAMRLKEIFTGGPPTIFSAQLHKHFIKAPLPNGEFRILHTTVSPVPQSDRRGYYALAILQDVTDVTNRIQEYRMMRDRALAEIEERKQAELALSQKTQELQQRNFELTELSKMSNFLQVCLTIEEAYKAIAASVQVLLPEISGALFKIDESREFVEAVVTWGELLSDLKSFIYSDCWALRRSQPHWVTQRHPNLVCKHIHSEPAEYCCIPVMAQGQALGLLYLSAAQPGKLTTDKQLLVAYLTEHISLALANLKLRETLQEQSIRDPLTGLYNRRYMEEFLTREIDRALRKQLPLGMIMLDVDHFKRCNDTFGHEAGDTVLRKLGHFLHKSIRNSDIACRYGGEEFILILPEANLENSVQRAGQINQGIRQLEIVHNGQVLDRITTSMGVACFPTNGSTFEEVIRAADAALYQAKKQGRDRVEVA
ncbi:diguanylate cyclase [Planktothricoides sp. FACHB-1370]|uniref:Diguanylate cyclase n=1 Tax=Planktothricoides raciborskii FACHB-1370 TaxID=2949576 RepID=A0ABR8ELL7_9CYAN|nr:diguanylate cyclase [Planktothricoides sp. SR001]MBD2547566.1 diguanylate cyclase [Planktothricoides raciborskii FACHB-1370]MBD2586043.1 diguanylate cyclase [Planktothricoides raciborskii FACHB-1261]